MKTEYDLNRERASKLSELILANPNLGVVAWIDTDGISDDYSYLAGNLGEPRIETIAVNYDNVYITKEGDDYEDCLNYYGYDADEWTDEELAEKAKAIPWEDVIAVAVSAS